MDADSGRDDVSEMADEPFSRNELAALRDGSYLAHDFRRALATIATLESQLAAVMAQRDKLSTALREAVDELHGPTIRRMERSQRFDALLTETATPQREINDAINYKNLLWKYINYVREEESITFIERIGDSWVDHEIAFTDEETVELRRLDAMKEYE